MACSMCGGVGLYRVGASEFCKVHKWKAVAASARDPFEAERRLADQRTRAAQAITHHNKYRRRLARGYPLDANGHTPQVRCQQGDTSR